MHIHIDGSTERDAGRAICTISMCENDYSSEQHGFSMHVMFLIMPDLKCRDLAKYWGHNTLAWSTLDVTIHA